MDCSLCPWIIGGHLNSVSGHIKEAKCIVIFILFIEYPQREKIVPARNANTGRWYIKSEPWRYINFKRKKSFHLFRHLLNGHLIKSVYFIKSCHLVKYIMYFLKAYDGNWIFEHLTGVQIQKDIVLVVVPLSKMVSTRGPKSPRYFEKGEKVLCYEPDKSKAKVLYDSKVSELIGVSHLLLFFKKSNFSLLFVQIGDSHYSIRCSNFISCPVPNIHFVHRTILCRLCPLRIKNKAYNPGKCCPWWL